MFNRKEFKGAMNRSNRISAFARLGSAMKNLPGEEKEALFQRACHANAWFTPDSLEMAWQGIIYMLDEHKLTQLMTRYPDANRVSTVGVTMAGNIPMVGFHDFLCVLLAGHAISMKPSSSDSVLMLYIADFLKQIEPRFVPRIQLVDRLNGVNAAIATGSNNSARYFEYYFRSIPHIIRKNRTSCAILDGTETPGDLASLGQDVFSYYGLGCRNVSTLFVPEAYDFTPLLDAWQSFHAISDHHKYANNLDYQKAILLVNKIPFLDGGHVLLTASEQLLSPISVLHYRHYSDMRALDAMLESVAASTQIILSNKGKFANSKAFGTAQRPEPDDFADRVDTLDFLSKL